MITIILAYAKQVPAWPRDRRQQLDHVNVQALIYRARRWRDLFETTNQVDHISRFERKNKLSIRIYEADLLTTAMLKRGKFHTLLPGFPRPGWKPTVRASSADA
jgi:hypothetical protein